MRWIVAQPGPGFSVADVHNGWCEALRAAGQSVLEFPLDSALTFYNSVLLETEEKGKFRKALTTEQAIGMAVDRLYASVLKFRPHVLLVISAFFTPPELLHIVRAAGVKVIIIHTESPYEDERQLAIASWADMNLVNDPTNLDRFQALGPAEYIPHAYRPSVHHPASGEKRHDFVFVGTGFPSRVEFLERMDLSGLDVALAGNWALLDDDHPLRAHVVDGGDCCDNTDAADLYRASRVGLNLYRREHRDNDTADGWAMGPREVEQAACGLFFLRDPRPEGDEVLDMLPTFTGPRDAAEQLRWWLAHPGYRETVAIKARAAVADRTFDAHAARLLRLLDKE